MAFNFWQLSQQEEEFLEADFHHPPAVINPLPEFVAAGIHGFQGAALQQPSAAQCLVEFKQVCGGGNDASPGPVTAQAFIPADLHAVKPDWCKLLFWLIDWIGVEHQVGIIHFQGAEKRIPQVFGKGFSGNFFDDQTQQDITGIRVVEDLPGDAGGGLIFPGIIDQFLRRPVRCRIGQDVRPGRISRRWFCLRNSRRCRRCGLKGVQWLPAGRNPGSCRQKDGPILPL